MKILPKKPSELLKLALADLKAIELDPRYRINMNIWYKGSLGSIKPQCSVCLAGSVMARQLDAPIRLTLYPTDFPENCHQLNALNEFREGQVGEAFWSLDLPHSVGYDFNRTIPDYDDNRAGFHAAMEQLVQDLQANGY